MRKYLLLAFTLSIALLVVLAQRLTVATPQSGNASTPNLEVNTSLSMIGASPTVTETPTATPTSTPGNSYLPMIALEATPTPTNTPIPTNTPTVTPTPTPPYPRDPWLLQDGQVEYVSNNANHWVQGKISWPDGDPIEGFHVQICLRDGSACSAPSFGSGPDGSYNWVGYAGPATSGDYYAVVADCTGTTGNELDGSIGQWEICEEHSERAYFSMKMEERAIAIINWVLVYAP